MPKTVSFLLSVAVLTMGLACTGAAPALARHDPWDGPHFGRSYERYDHHDFGRRPGWDSGYWHHGDRGGRIGWWWVVGDSWNYYPRRIAPVPDPYYVSPVVVVQPQIIRQAPQTIVVTQPSNMVATQTSGTYVDSIGRTCREYQSTILVGGTPQPAYGTACQQGNGSWLVVQ